MDAPANAGTSWVSTKLRESLTGMAPEALAARAPFLAPSKGSSRSRFAAADPLPFHALVPLTRLQVAMLLRPPVGPLDHRAFHAIVPPQPERHRQLRLRQIARPALDHAPPR